MSSQAQREDHGERGITFPHARRTELTPSHSLPAPAVMHAPLPRQQTTRRKCSRNDVAAVPNPRRRVVMVGHHLRQDDVDAEALRRLGQQVSERVVGLVLRSQQELSLRASTLEDQELTGEHGTRRGQATTREHAAPRAQLRHYASWTLRQWSTSRTTTSGFRMSIGQVAGGRCTRKSTPVQSLRVCARPIRWLSAG